MSPFDELLKRALIENGFKSWSIYTRAWWMKLIWNFNSRKFQALIMAMFISLISGANEWIVLSMLATYAGANVVESLEVFKKK